MAGRRPRPLRRKVHTVEPEDSPMHFPTRATRGKTGQRSTWKGTAARVAAVTSLAAGALVAVRRRRAGGGTPSAD